MNRSPERRDAHRAFELAGSRQRYGPDRPLRVDHIDLRLKPDLEKRTIEGVCTTTFSVTDDAVERVLLDAVDLEITGVRDEDGRELTHEVRSRTLAIDFGRRLERGTKFRIAIDYRLAEPRRGAYFTKPTPAEPNKPVQLWTQSQDQDARYWFPCLDDPDLKQTSSTTIVVARGLFALSNGALAERRDEADSTIFVYRQEIPHATYLFSVVVGAFSEIPQSGARVPTFYYVEPGREADGERSFGATPKMMSVFENFIGVPYPYERYSQIAVRDFIFGGMENTTATTQTDQTLHDARAHLDFSSDPLVSHELAHQWFGNLVTTRDWSHAWLNEGFASYFEAVYLEADLGWDEYLYHVAQMVKRYLDEDAKRYRRPIVHNRYDYPIELFDRHLYDKGGAALHMLRGVLGADGFRRSILRYVRDNAGGSVETIDLVRAIEHETGANLRSFFDRWILAPGHPEIEVAYRWDQSRGVAIVTVRQTQASDGESVHGFDISIGFAAKPAAVARNAGDAELPDERRTRLRIERATESFTIPLESEPGLVRIDPGAYLLGSVEYALGTAMNVAILRSESDPIARIRAAKALARDPSRVARETLAGALRDEPFWAVAAEVAAALGETRAPFAHDALLRTTAHPHPKVRRAVAAALGSWRDGAVVDALLGLLDDESYLVAGTALTSLGKTRDRRAFDVLSDHVRVPSWNETIARDALLGLAELADSRVVPILIGAAEVDRPASLRRAALGALARAAELLDQRHPSIGDAVTRALDDDAVSIKAAAIEAAACMGWRDAIPALRRRSRDDDGGLRRAALEAIRRIEEAAHVNAEVANLRREVSELRERLEELRQETEPRKGST